MADDEQAPQIGVRQQRRHNMIILQGVTRDNHLEAIAEVLAVEEPQRIIISVAFANEAGVAMVEDCIQGLNDRACAIIGIRNGITSAQALRRCLSTGCKLYVVDTGTRSVIFHPKIYFSRSATEARLVIGSANLTYGGLISNIEASVLLTFDLNNEDHLQMVDDLEHKLDQLLENFEENVFEIDGDNAIVELLAEGRVTDETVKPPPVPIGSSNRRGADRIPRMPLNVRHVPRIARPPAALEGIEGGHPDANINRSSLVWQSSPLKRRDLNIPTSPNTAATGSMLFKKGASDIDQQTYFREHVFHELDWIPDQRTPGKELAEAEFQIVIGLVDFGKHTLTVTHDTRTNTRSFEQRQPMSALRWGTAKQIIAREDLLDRTISLYRTGDNKFVIEID